MKKYTANYCRSNHNFVIQNLPDSVCAAEYYPAICIIKNILQRGTPTTPSKFLKTEFSDYFKNTESNTPVPLISSETPVWERIIRGDTSNNYIPAQKFYEKLIPKYFKEYPFVQQLIVPEVPINWITMIPVNDFQGQQVDFYLPQAFLVIEIDGSGHVEAKDSVRDAHLAKFGVKTVRITTFDLEKENQLFQSKIEEIKKRIDQITRLQLEKKQYEKALITFKDYREALNKNPDPSSSSAMKLTAIIRFQILLLELLGTGVIRFGEKWNIALLAEEKSIAELAFRDLCIWFKHLCRLQKIPFQEPTLNLVHVSSKAELASSALNLKIDFSISKRYTDEFQDNTDIIYVRTDYFDHYRLYRQANAVNPTYVRLEPIDYFELAACDLVNYRFQFGGVDEDHESLVFFLENIFGYTSFNTGQIPIITNALSRNDTLGLLPTGSGKSICYQLACLLQPGISFVVCPIKSLMYDQKADLDQNSISRVNYVTGDQEGEEKDWIMSRFSQGKYFFILISPERFQTKTFRSYLLELSTRSKFAYAVIDEVHCLSEWGHDFRTSYLNLAKTINKFCAGLTPLGLTATASLNVLKDITVEFGISEQNVKTLTDYSRKELLFKVIDDNNNKTEAIKTLITTLRDEEDIFDSSDNVTKCGIVFTSTVNGPKGCHKVSQNLQQAFNVPVNYYSGSVPAIDGISVMEPSKFEGYKKQVQEDFKNNRFNLLAATKAFGMGVNKRNIYFTIHYGIPGSMEALYQEAGRAGRDKSVFTADTPARCYVLFTKSTNEGLLNTVWDRSTPLTVLKNTLRQIDGDINTNLFLFTSSMDLIKEEFVLIVRVFEKYAVSGREGVTIKAHDLQSHKSKVEKAIYRLSQLGIVSDWTIENFYSGEFTVDFLAFTERSMQEALIRTIGKYDKEFDFENLDSNEGYANYHAIWNKSESVRDRCIVLLLQWAYDHFVYNRRQSLKNIYEACKDFADNSINASEFQEIIENYFKFTEASYVLQHIAENPRDISKWFEVFYQVEDNRISNKIINTQQRQSLLANLSRFLESYEYNTGLDFISGTLRLLVDDFENIDGRKRFESSFRQIAQSEKAEFDFVLRKLLLLGKEMVGRNKRELAMALHKMFPDDGIILRIIQKELGDEYSTEVLVSSFHTRLTNLNTEIYEGLVKTR